MKPKKQKVKVKKIKETTNRYLVLAAALAHVGAAKDINTINEKDVNDFIKSIKRYHNKIIALNAMLDGTSKSLTEKQVNNAQQCKNAMDLFEKMITK